MEVMNGISYKSLLIHIMCIILGQYLCWYQSKLYYTRKRSHVYDIFHKFLPYYDNKYIYVISNLYNTCIVLYLIYNVPGILAPSILLYLKIMIIRAVAINITILPKQKECDSENFGIMSVIVGHCNDKIISGHFASLFIVTLYALNAGFISSNTMMILNIINAIIILVTRWHYSIDILMAIIVVIFAKDNL